MVGLLVVGKIPARLGRFLVGNLCDGDRLLTAGTASARA